MEHFIITTDVFFPSSESQPKAIGLSRECKSQMGFYSYHPRVPEPIMLHNRCASAEVIVSATEELRCALSKHENSVLDDEKIAVESPNLFDTS